MFSNQCYEKWVSVRERIIKVLLGTVTCVAKTETFTCIIATEIPVCVITIIIVTYIFAEETVT